MLPLFSLPKKNDLGGGASESVRSRKEEWERKERFLGKVFLFLARVGGEYIDNILDYSVGTNNRPF